MDYTPEDIENISIVGGGVAGWLTALRLQKSFEKRNLRPSISVIESPDEPIIGVGEATVDSFPQFLKELEISTSEFIANVKATFKNGILYENWNPRRPFFFHPYFGGSPKGNFIQECLRNGMSLDRLFISTYLAKFHRSPCAGQGEPSVNHAYHFDTAKLAGFLTGVAARRGIQKIVSKVNAVERGSDGTIKSLHTTYDRRIYSDLFFDCSGFHSVLLGRGLGLKFISYCDYLLNDRALAGHIPYAEFQSDPPPYTRATAMKYGWRWTIPTAERLGVGYVYSSQFIDDISAEKEFRKAAKIPRNEPLKKIQMNIGHYENFMYKNCVGIGLSAGFIEPLESSGLRFITRGLDLFTKLLFEKSENIDGLFNEGMRLDYESTRNFVALHFMASPRSDTPYWLRQGELWKGKTEIKDICRYFHTVLEPGFNDWYSEKIRGWETRNYLCILDGLGYYKQFPKKSRSKENTKMKVGLQAFSMFNKEKARSFLGHRHGISSLITRRV